MALLGVLTFIGVVYFVSLFGLGVYQCYSLNLIECHSKIRFREDIDNDAGVSENDNFNEIYYSLMED